MVKFSRKKARTLAENGRLGAIAHNYVGIYFWVTIRTSPCDACFLLSTRRFSTLHKAVFGECLWCLKSQNCQFLHQLPHPLVPADIKQEANLAILELLLVVCWNAQPCHVQKNFSGKRSFFIHILSSLHYHDFVLNQCTFAFLSYSTLVVSIECMSLTISRDLITTTFIFAFKPFVVSLFNCVVFKYNSDSNLGSITSSGSGLGSMTSAWRGGEGGDRWRGGEVGVSQLRGDECGQLSAGEGGFIDVVCLGSSSHSITTFNTQMFYCFCKRQINHKKIDLFYGSPVSQMFSWLHFHTHQHQPPTPQHQTFASTTRTVSNKIIILHALQTQHTSFTLTFKHQPTPPHHSWFNTCHTPSKPICPHLCFHSTYINTNHHLNLRVNPFPAQPSSKASPFLISTRQHQTTTSTTPHLHVNHNFEIKTHSTRPHH